MGPFLRFGRLLAPVTTAAFAISLVAACNAQVATVLASDTDAAAPPAATTPGGEGGSPTATTPTPGGGPAPIDPAFCTGSNARMKINGDDVPILDMKGKAIAMNCCDSAMLTIATGRFQALFHVLWRVPASRPAEPIDVSTLTQQGGGGLELDLGCDPSTTSCATASAVDRYDSGFTGTIEYTPTSNGVDTSYCLSVAEPAGSPHIVLHSVQIYVPSLASTY